MKTKSLTTLAATALLLALFAGCTTAPGPFTPQDTTKYTVENTEKFVLLDQPTQVSVTCTGLQERTLPDGRIEVVANVKNRETRRIQVQVNCVFKDEQGFTTGDETPFQTLILAENSTEAVRFTAMNALAKKYTIRVRQAR
ncbi:MAG: YcfL family protein [Verrucomicrobiota bacterium]